MPISILKSSTSSYDNNVRNVDNNTDENNSRLQQQQQNTTNPLPIQPPYGIQIKQQQQSVSIQQNIINPLPIQPPYGIQVQLQQQSLQSSIYPVVPAASNFLSSSTSSSSTSTTSTAVQIPCCLCGTMIYPNNANQCYTCLAQQFNLSQRLNTGPSGTDLTIYQCRECRRYHRLIDKIYDNCELESNQLLSLCLKHIPALNRTSNTTTTGTTGSSTSYNTSNDKNEIQLASIKVIDAVWIWTEPHCQRLKIALTVQAKLCDVPVQQRCIINFVVSWRQCSDCLKEYRHRTWHAIVQIRQKQQLIQANTKSTFNDTSTTNTKQQQKIINQTKHGLHVIEQALRNAKSTIRQHVLKVDHVKCGFDFYFMNLSYAQNFVSYIQSIVPMKTKISTKLVSTDSKNNTAHVKHTITCDIVPLLKNDLVLIDQHMSPQHSLSGKLAIVTSLSSGMITFHDACITSLQPKPKQHQQKFSKKSVEQQQQQQQQQHRVVVSADNYYKQEKHYTVVQSSADLCRFVVLDVDLVNEHYHNNNNNNNKSNPISSNSSIVSGNTHQSNTNTTVKYTMAEVQVARECDMGVTDDIYYCITHLGHLLKVGDIVLGYDLLASTRLTSLLSNDDFSSDITKKPVRNNFICPDIVLIQKVTLSKSKFDSHYINCDDESQYHISSSVSASAVSHSQRNHINSEEGIDTEHNNMNNINQDEDNDDELDDRTTITKSTMGGGTTGTGSIGTKSNISTINQLKKQNRRVSKAKQRRQVRRQGKRKIDLEQSAIRMGLIPDPNEMDAIIENDNDIDNDNNTSSGSSGSSNNKHNNISNSNKKKNSNILPRTITAITTVASSSSLSNNVATNGSNPNTTDTTVNDSITNNRVLSTNAVISKNVSTTSTPLDTVDVESENIDVATSSNSFDTELVNDPELAKQLQSLLGLQDD